VKVFPWVDRPTSFNDKEENVSPMNVAFEIATFYKQFTLVVVAAP